MYLISSFVMAVLCYAILRYINSLMGPIHNARTGDCNDSIKMLHLCSGMVYWSGLVRKRGEGRGKGRWVEKSMRAQTHTHIDNLYPNLLQISAHVLLAPATAAVSCWFSPSVNEEAGWSREKIHTQGAHKALQMKFLYAQTHKHIPRHTHT